MGQLDTGNILEGGCPALLGQLPQMPLIHSAEGFYIFTISRPDMFLHNPQDESNRQ